MWDRCERMFLLTEGAMEVTGQSLGPQDSDDHRLPARQVGHTDTKL